MSVEAFAVTRFDGLDGKSKVERVLTVDQLVTAIRERRAPSKTELPLLKLAKFGDVRSAKGSLRHDENVISVSGGEADYDGELVPFDEAVTRLRETGVLAIAYTSPSHRPDGPRWRVLCPFSAELLPDRRAAMMDRLNGILGGVLARESWTLSQGFFYGTVDDAVDYRVEVIEGRCIDLCNELDGAARGKPNGAAHGVAVASAAASVARPCLEALPAEWQEIIRSGDSSKWDGDDSDAVAAVAKVLVRARWGDDTIAAVLLDPALGISKHCRNENDSERAARRAIDLARRVEPEIADVNEHHAVILIGDQVAILRESGSPEEREPFRLLKVGAFKQWMLPRLVHRENAGRKTVTMPLADYWLKNPQRREYEGMVFAPGRDAPGYYNLWRGFAVEPRPGECSKFLDHLRDNVCRGDPDLFNWVVGWFAAMFQQPDRKIGTSLVIRGKQGAGKTKVGQVIGSLLGHHYVEASEPRYVTGRFNAHLVSCLLLHADEGFFAGDRAAEGKLKDLVTGDYHFIEFKNKDAFRVRNFIRLLVSGNPDWIVPAGMEERRFAVLEISEEHLRDYAYFAAIDAEMGAGGREALLHYLMTFDLSGLNLREIPRTAALLDQKVESLTTEQKWWFDFLCAGRLPNGCSDASSCPAVMLFDDYVRHAEKQGARRRSIETQIGMFLRRMMPKSMRRFEATYQAYTGPEVGSVYLLPPLGACRSHFADAMQQEIEWDADRDWVKRGSDEQRGDTLPYRT